MPEFGYYPCMSSLLPSFLDLVFPPRCTFCDNICDDPICPDCLSSVRFITPPFCSICGAPFASDAGRNRPCGECLKKKRHYSWSKSVLLYNEATSASIHRFKYKPDTTLSIQLGSLISGCELPEGIDVAVPVPLHIKRLRERGFNQSLVLAEAVGKKRGFPVDPFILKRSRWTEPQVNLKGKDRKLNVKGAFEVVKDVRGKRVLLVDDVFTTGATVDECSRVLRKCGARSVSVLTLARAAAL